MRYALLGTEGNNLHPDFMELDQSESAVKAPCNGDQKKLRPGYGKVFLW